ncbi:MAG: AraC family transcriptional regulator [Bacteroidetes bacterium]|nr:AraC family transcriptional regulator [Bacteroidota bacterium]
MKLYIRYNINTTCKSLLQEQLDKLGLTCELTGLGELELKNGISADQHNQLSTVLKKYGIEVLDDRISSLVQKTKDTIIEMLYLEEKLPPSKVSFYLAQKLNYSFGYISNLFSEVTFISIENFIIMQKIERVKQLIIANELTFTQIASKLNYSSSAHLSWQFKKITGLTPSSFQRIIKKRRENNGSNAEKELM